MEEQSDAPACCYKSRDGVGGEIMLRAGAGNQHQQNRPSAGLGREVVLGKAEKGRNITVVLCSPWNT